MDFSKIIYKLNLFLLFFLIILNLFTVFSPEIGFDALWYHLTLPRLWLLKHQWFFPGGLLYYSVMPRLTELIYIPLISISGSIGPKMIQFLSGIGTSYIIYKISSKLGLNKLFSLLAVNIFYITWLVSWQSGSAYIDLFRTFLETFALYFFIENRKKTGALFLGLAIGTKWLSLGSLAIYTLVFGLSILPISLLVSLPWFLIAYHFTGNPVYPIFEPFLNQTTPNLLSGIYRILCAPYFLTFPFDDFLSPIIGSVLIFSSLSIIFSKNQLIRKLAIIAGLGACFSLFLNPPSSRFFLPYLPAASISGVYFISILPNIFKKYIYVIFSASFILVICLRLIAIQKYIPYWLGRETQNQFLTKMSPKMPGTFIDSDNFVIDHIPANSRILINNLHNLYYFPLNFDHSSWANNSIQYDYLISEKENPSKINGDLIHTNSLGIQVFKLNHD